MNKKSLVFSSLLIILTIIVGACSQVPASEPTLVPTKVPTEIPPTEAPTQEPALEPIVVVDDLGVEIELTEPAQSIISISPSLTEILYGVGAGDRLVGRDSNSTYPEAALEAEDLGAMWEGIPVESILAMEPDIILAGEIFSSEAIQELRDLGLVVYWQKNPDDFEGLYQNIKDISILTGTEDEADALIKTLREKVDALDKNLANVEVMPLVFYELDASDPANPYTAGAGTFISFVISRSKGQNLGDRLEGEYAQISSEALVAENPDFILLADALYGVTPESVADRAGWGDIKAVINENIYPFDPFILSVPGPRLITGFEEVSKILHPEIFE
jgi:iron complex transport system substrate-binding protein